MTDWEVLAIIFMPVLIIVALYLEFKLVQAKRLINLQRKAIQQLTVEKEIDIWYD